MSSSVEVVSFCSAWVEPDFGWLRFDFRKEYGKVCV